MGIESSIDTPLAHAVRKFGSQSAFARFIGKSQASVHEWLRDGKLLPGEHVLKVEAETGISRHELNPEIFGEAPTSPPTDIGQLEEARR